MLRAPLTLLLLFIIGSCSGGGGSDPAGDIIDRSGRSVGRISAFGSIVVNGVAYETTGSVITVNDRPGQESELAVGQIVAVVGVVDAGGTTGVAETVSLDPYLRGPVAAIDLDTSTLSILGTEVSVVSSTLFGESISPAELASIVLGEPLEVHGYASSSGGLVATLIERTTESELELRGRVAALDSDARTFSVNSFTVDYGGAVLEGFSGDIANGDLVEAEGLVVNGTVLIADRVELESATEFSSADEDTEVELEGIVTSFVNAMDFQVGSTLVTTNSATEFEDGDATDLALDARIEVEGTINANGVLVASEISFELESNLEAEAPVEAVDLPGQTVTVLGLRLAVTAQTQLIDESDTQLQFFSLSDVSPGDFVKLKAFTDGLSATLDLLKRKNPEDALKLKGSVATISPPSLFIDTAQIDTDAATSFEIDDVTATANEFFTALEAGDVVSAKGQTPGVGVLLAEELSIK